MASRNRGYQLRHLAEGKCSICGNGALVASERCKACLEKYRAKDRQRKGCKPHVKGGRGRPPKEG